MKKAFRTVGFMFMMIMFSKILGQAREMLVAGLYGGNLEAGAFYAASALPLNLFDIVFASAVSSAFIPVYNTFLARDGDAEGDRFASAFVNAIGLGSLLLCLLLMLLASPLVAFLFGGRGDFAFGLTVRLAVVMLPVTVFASLAFSFVGILQSRDEFSVPALLSLALNLTMLAYLLFFNKYFGIFGLAASMSAGWLLQFAIQIPVAKKRGFKYSFVLRHRGLKQVARLALPVMAGTWMQPISAITGTAFAARLAEAAAVPSLNYANKLYVIVSSVFTASITNYIFPRLSRQAANDEGGAYGGTLNLTLKVIILFLIPVSCLLLALAEPIIEIVYKRGAFGENELALTAGAFFYYSLGILFYGTLDLLNKAFYARKNALVPALVSVAAIIFNIASSWALKGGMGVFGLALSSSLTALLASVALYVFLNRELKFFNAADLLDGAKALGYGIAAYAAAALLYRLLPFPVDLCGKLLKIAVAGLSGGGAYLAAAYFTIGDVRDFLKKNYSLKVR
jgi:murein biosynthesis integral membrane protein MurJ